MTKTSRTFIHSLVFGLTLMMAPLTLWSQTINVSLSPSTATVNVGQTFQFTAKVTPGSKSGVTWNVNGITGGNATVGTISVSGLYTAPNVVPSSSSVTVSVISTADSSVSAQATVTVVPTGPSVTVSPSTAFLQLYQTQQFTATVSGLSNASVTWSVNGVTGGNSTNGTISTSGLYTAPAAVPPTAITVTATSVADSSKFGQGAVTVITPTLTISPSPTTVSTLQSTQFGVVQTGGGSKKPATYTWTVNGIQGGNAVVGTISNKGVYTAPAIPPSPATTTIMVISSSNQSGLASATIVSGVSVSVSPASASVIVSQMQQFTATVRGTSNTSVTWSVNGVAGGNSTVGMVSTNGLYTAPNVVPVPASVIVTATAAADPTKSASATVNVNPTATVTVSVSPASVTLSNSQIQQFAATVTGSSNSLVVWSLSAALGAISASGQYQAPSSIAAPQTVTVTATTVVDPITRGSATVSLVPDTTPPSVTLTSPGDATTVGGSVPLTATASDNVGVVGVRFLVDGLAVSSEVTTAPYAAPWSTSTYQNGAHTVSAIARDAAGNTATSSVNVTVSNATTQVILPVEVVGGPGTTQTVTVNLSSPPVSGARLWMQIHNLKYQTEASVQINGGLWLPINDSTVTLEGLASSYGGIGGGFSTLKISLSVPTGALVAGENTITFQFNDTDGVTSGFRVLSFNFLDSNGNQLISADTFVQDDPNTWQPPSTLADDIAAGQLLWQTASLTTPGVGAIQAKCGSCHTQDGRDLKYFNYSNNSIQARAMFHGLSTDQANQIVDYIRSLNVPNPGRPWNPPYQPGPGLDSLPVENWAAGAGLDAVLDHDADMLPYLMPGGDTTAWAPTANLSAREIPVALQFLDWNRWLPTVHPIDAFGSTFTNDQLFTDYQAIRAGLKPGDPASYQQQARAIWYLRLRIYNWMVANKPAFTDPTWDATNGQQFYSVALWLTTKLWEINQEFGLEGMAQTAFGPQADSRAWYSSVPFYVSPNQIQIPLAGQLGNGKASTRTFLSYSWYSLQLILNPGNGQFVEGTPVDFPYTYNFVSALESNDVPDSVRNGPLMLLWLIKALQESQHLPGPENGSQGWAPNANRAEHLFTLANLAWRDLSTSSAGAAMEGYLHLWLDQVKTYTPQQFYQGGWATPSEIPDPTSPDASFGSYVASMIPQANYFGVSQTLLTNLVTWAQTVWPSYNWNALLTAVCTPSQDLWLSCPVAP